MMRSVKCLTLTAALALPLFCTQCRTATDEGPETAPVGPSALDAATTKAALSGNVDFVKHVRPVLESHCLPCHNPKGMPGLMNLLSREQTLAPGPHGPRIVPGKPDESLLIKNLSMTHAPVKVMPPVGNRLTPDETKVLRRWITQGAAWPTGSAGQLKLRGSIAE